MAHLCKIIISAVLVMLILLQTFADARPRPGNSKIRIHVPVKHHTHYHTKTLLKTIHVPIKTHHHHDDIDSGWAKSGSWSKSYKKKKIRPAFY
jgi:hypothetical protein